MFYPCVIGSRYYLMPNYRHFCKEWDFLEIDEDDSEFEACMCPFKGDSVKIQFAHTPNLFEIFPLDKWSRDHTTRILGGHQIGYDITPTTMGYSFRFRTKEDYELAKSLIQNAEVE